YAIDVATGKRLNMFFGENTWLKEDNGNDMRWNPSSRIVRTPADNVTGGYVMGGQHYLYVMADEYVQGINSFDNEYKGSNPQDHPLYNEFTNMTLAPNRRKVFQSVMWATVPLVTPAFEDVNLYTSMPSDVAVRIRLDKPFGEYVVDNSNNGLPKYGFSTTSISAKTNRTDVAKGMLDSIKVVPNPYYGWSEYETSQLDNTVKITNLPRTCTISIFNTSGTLIRQIRKDNTLTYTEWDLRNRFNIPIAGGVYIIHIDAGELGETVVKWFGALRPVDLNAF
ncbi:MAG: T9SS C-terminal target domain-containing protein, partial [Bacteroidota bacterium]|nr:T9SS C-terminal target domain-containing protein [Bacteroidota bacterium]MDX5505753.1 T9SS C-terminal target domain-containing protein [Bacteroidota bacterium]